MLTDFCVTEYKYLETVLDNKLNFNKNNDFIHKKSVYQKECVTRWCSSIWIFSFVGVLPLPPFIYKIPQIRSEM